VLRRLGYVRGAQMLTGSDVRIDRSRMLPAQLLLTVLKLVLT